MKLYGVTDGSVRLSAKEPDRYGILSWAISSFIASVSPVPQPRIATTLSSFTYFLYSSTALGTW
ncbi:MAG: hypothetical protein A6D92_08795 [Symbiobacterium thermophilum]|uniref:Uncharacterized protein n=1 Tax=Symbiobacterium thermophilum TaxID=2734 RepID=A0A1Y2T7M7_SYMTR|nr:MAG: hypothetical protein A6D92_08795 [Symbiobacterium thermophilum]